MVSLADYVICNSSLCMHLAGAFKVPALTLLGEWYDSKILHEKQWGYPESMVLGKELEASVNEICHPNKAHELVLKGIEQTNA